MRVRYGRNEKGKLIRQAEIYSLDEHNISRDRIDRDARKIISRLHSVGYEAYVVGGAVRDLLLDRKPKDFDIATDATPNQIKRVFRNSRIIGRRFRLVHIYFANDKIIEVATFRSIDSGERDEQIFGTVDEDALRRDFSLNALYYDPDNEEILDFVNGVRDIKKKILRSVIPLDKTFQEDPVRMIRAVKYSVGTGSRIPFLLRRKIKKSAPLLHECSISRMSEELFKILQSGTASPCFRRFRELRLFETILPQYSILMDERGAAFEAKFFESMELLDRLVGGGEKRRSRMLVHLLECYLEETGAFDKGRQTSFKEVIKRAKGALKPLIAPNREIDEAVKQILRKRKIWSNQKSSRSRSRRRKGKQTTANQEGG
ncbi:MAG: polynucleotide adenylyltransferase PcnB [Spirochaetales bacterium]|nr:polynucleotide adenylyltransferase PcnB [Spirochaetales bacterium]